MRSKIIVLAVPILALSAYMMFASQGLGPDLIPILPGEVEVDSNNHYTQTGYHYFYVNARWYFASSRGGQRHELPRSRWPQLTHQQGWDRPVLIGRLVDKKPEGSSLNQPGDAPPVAARLVQLKSPQ